MKRAHRNIMERNAGAWRRPSLSKDETIELMRTEAHKHYAQQLYYRRRTKAGREARQSLIGCLWILNELEETTCENI